MPVHRVPRQDLEPSLIAIEREGGEDIVHIVPDGDDYLVITRRRYATHRGGVQ